MLALQLYVPPAALPGTLDVLRAQDGVSHIVRSGSIADGDLVELTAELHASAVDQLLPRLVACGVSAEEITVLRRDGSRPLAQERPGDRPSWSGGPLAWSELSMASRQYARAVPQYLVLMGAAGIIAAFGVLTRNQILIVGAMAISPDLLPLCATCVGLVDRRPRLARRAFAVLVIGLATATAASFLITVLLRWSGYSETKLALGNGGLGVLPTVGVATVVVAFVAGIVGILAFETRSSAAVGVAISITTIPAAAFAGSAIALGDTSGARGGIGVLVANIAMLLLGGTATLVAQQVWRRRVSADRTGARTAA